MIEDMLDRLCMVVFFRTLLLFSVDGDVSILERG